MPSLHVRRHSRTFENHRSGTQEVPQEVPTCKPDVRHRPLTQDLRSSKPAALRRAHGKHPSSREDMAYHLVAVHDSMMLLLLRGLLQRLCQRLHPRHTPKAGVIVGHLTAQPHCCDLFGRKRETSNNYMCRCHPPALHRASTETDVLKLGQTHSLPSFYLCLASTKGSQICA